ncbi:LicD family protein [Chryseobacterium artocarpi]|uniref:LicD family protein n=1 Tax=Chryseobacterium artocarpi TaxID=1414727 RepID=UPI003F358BCF
MIFQINKDSVFLHDDHEIIEISSDIPLQKSNIHYHTQKYGFEMCPQDIQNYSAHIFIWEYILKHNIEAPCVVIENDLRLNCTYETIANETEPTSNDWDIVIPYNKLNVETDLKNEIFPSRLGYYWGSYFYIVNGKNIEKLLSLKVIRQPVDEEILEASFNNTLKTLLIDTDWFEFNEKKCPVYQNRSSFFLEKIQEINVWESNHKEQAISIMTYLANKSKELNLNLFAHAGTLLGIVRHDDIMPWDDDVDLCMDEQEIQTLLDAVQEENIIKYTKSIWHKTGFEYYKFFYENGEYKNGYEYTFPFVDIWLLFHRENSFITSDGYEAYTSDYLPGKEYSLHQAPILLPQNHESILNKMYKNWDKYIKVFSWSHRQKENSIDSIIAPIKTDNTGKLITY